MKITKIIDEYGFCMESERYLEELGECENMQQVVDIVKKDIKNICDETAKRRLNPGSEDYGIEERIIEIDGVLVDDDDEVLKQIEEIGLNTLNRHLMFSIKVQHNDRYDSITDISYGITNKK